MFGIGWTEIIVIALVLLIFVGPKNLPPLMQKVGMIVREFKSASRELRNQLDVEVKDLQSPKTLMRSIGKDVLDGVADPYEEIRQEDRKLKQAIREAGDPPKSVKYAPNEPSSVSVDDSDQPEDTIKSTEGTSTEVSKSKVSDEGNS